MNKFTYNTTVKINGIEQYCAVLPDIQLPLDPQIIELIEQMANVKFVFGEQIELDE